MEADKIEDVRAKIKAGTLRCEKCGEKITARQKWMRIACPGGGSSVYHARACKKPEREPLARVTDEWTNEQMKEALADLIQVDGGAEAGFFWRVRRTALGNIRLETSHGTFVVLVCKA